jgi:hypothetical protein
MRRGTLDGLLGDSSVFGFVAGSAETSGRAVSFKKNAMSRQEFARAAAWYEGTEAKLDEVEAHVEEAPLLLRLCRNRLADGKHMPLIPLSASIAEELGGRGAGAPPPAGTIA